MIDVDLPTGYHLNPSAPQRYTVSVDGDKTIGIEPKNESHVGNDLRLPLRVPVRANEVGSATLKVQVTLFYCREDNTGTCRIKTLVWRAPINVTNDGGAPNEVKVHGKLTAE